MQAAAWRADMEAPESAAQVAAFEEWLSASPAHLLAYRQLDAITTVGERLAMPAQIVPQWQSTRRAAIVTTASLLLGGGLLSWWLIQEQSPAYTALTNSSPAVRTFRLGPDVTFALDTGASVDVRSQNSPMELRVTSGRLRARVERDSIAELKVVVPGGAVLAHGALFDVNAAGDETTVFALAGAPLRVIRSTHSGSTALQAGVGLKLVQGTVAMPPMDASWPDARIAYDRARLVQVIARANRGRRPKLVLADRAVGERRVSGVVDVRESRALARKLAAALDLSVTDRGNVVILAAKK